MRSAIAASVALTVLGVIGDARAADHDWIPIGRFAMGTALHVSKHVDGVAAFTLDVTAGASMIPTLDLNFFGKSDSFGIVLNAEGGYMYDHLNEDLHAFHATVGLGYGAFAFGGLYQPRFIIGRAGDDFAIGMRNGARLYAFWELGSLELAHQFVHHDGRFDQDIHILIGVSPWALFVL